jgi:hypothetical protein
MVEVFLPALHGGPQEEEEQEEKEDEEEECFSIHVCHKENKNKNKDKNKKYSNFHCSFLPREYLKISGLIHSAGIQCSV